MAGAAGRLIPTAAVLMGGAAAGAGMAASDPMTALAGRYGDHLRNGMADGSGNWSDGEGMCKSYCGARGSFLKGELPWSSRRPIRYMARLRASLPYREAVAAWRRDR